jgi:hypothetical protein
MALTFVVRAGVRRWRREGGWEDVWTPAGAEALARWLAEPQPGAPPGVSRYLFELHAARRDLGDAFDLGDGRAAGRYLHWVRERGRVEVDIPPRFLPAPPPGEPAAAVAAIAGRRWVHSVRHGARQAAQRALLRRERR